MVRLHLYEMCRKGKSLQAESRLVVAGAGGRGNWGGSAYRDGVSFGGGLNVLKSIVGRLHNSGNVLKTTEVYTLKG